MLNAILSHPLGRLIGRHRLPEPARAAPGVPTLAGRARALTAPLAGMAVAAERAARRPLVAVGGALAGFEFCVDSPQRARLRHDDATARTCTLSVLSAMRPCAEQGLIALAELPASWLARSLSDGVHVRGMYLVLGDDALFNDAEATTRLVTRLRDAGAMIGWRLPHDGRETLPAGRPDFLPLCTSQRAGVAEWRRVIADGARRWPDVPLVLLDVPDVPLMEAVLASPVALATCAVGVCESPAQPHALPLSAERLLLLLSLVVTPAEGARLATLQKSDMAVYRQLLQSINSSELAPLRGFESIERAIQTLGRPAIYHHVAQLLVAQAPQRPASAMLRAQTLARARLMESLALSAGDPDAGMLFLVGLASTLPLLMHCDVDDGLAQLLLPPQAIAALCEQTGPWARYVALVRALERHDMVAAEALALPFGGLQTVLALSAEAWRQG